MKHHFRIVAGLAFLLTTLTVAVYPSLAQDPADQKRLEIDTDHAAVPHGENDWDNQYTDPGAVMFYDGQFHMFRNGFVGWPASVQIAYTTSADGLTWEKHGEEPVLYTDDVEYADVAALASSVLVEDDGTWVLYFYTWPSSTDEDSVGAIGRATAPAPEGPWTPDEAPILLPGGENDWDQVLLISPSVVKTDEGYLMYYHSRAGATSNDMIGMATSEDGITWTKYNDPATTDAPYANSDPVFIPNFDNPEAWDGEHVNQPRVVLNEEGLVMLYRSFNGTQQDQSIGFAISEDGIHWTRLNEEPIFSNDDIRLRRIWFTAMAYNAGTYYLYLELPRGYQNQTEVFAGTYAGPLVTE